MGNVLIVSMAQVSDSEDPFSPWYYIKDSSDVDANGDVTRIPGFIWSQVKSNANLIEHKFSFYYARRIFDDGKYVYDEPDDGHSVGEDRRWAVGRAHLQPNKVLLVCETEPPDGTHRRRIYSARVLTSGHLKDEFEKNEVLYLAQSKKNYDYLKSLYDRMF